MISENGGENWMLEDRKEYRVWSLKMEAIFENNSENELEKLQSDSELCLRKRGPEQAKTNICMLKNEQ